MYCPHCGAQEHQPKQFCRACGADLRIVRSSIDRSLTPGGNTAKDEIGRALAQKINDLRTAGDLQTIAEEVLPEIEKFLESPAEKRLCRIRTGVITTLIGLGAVCLGPILKEITHDRDLMMLGLLGLIPFMIGLGTIINGLFFTTTRRRQAELDETTMLKFSLNTTNELQEVNNTQSPSVTEHTTHKLPSTSRQ